MAGEPIYLDYAASTPVDPRAREAMLEALANCPANPSNDAHLPGERAADLVAKARRQVSETINAPSRALVFTSGATESNALAILGFAAHLPADRRHVITSTVEQANELLKKLSDATDAARLEKSATHLRELVRGVNSRSMARAGRDFKKNPAWKEMYTTFSEGVETGNVKMQAATGLGEDAAATGGLGEMQGVKLGTEQVDDVGSVTGQPMTKPPEGT